jgi:hypothetical protein
MWHTIGAMGEFGTTIMTGRSAQAGNLGTLFGTAPFALPPTALGRVGGLGRTARYATRGRAPALPRDRFGRLVVGGGRYASG